MVAAEVCSATASRNGQRGVLVRLSNGRELEADAAVNCTGSSDDFTGATDPLIDGLLADGLSRPGAMGMGLDATSDGRLLDRSGAANLPIWAVGAVRRGELWESTAIPEIRAQAATAATAALLNAAVRR